MNLAGPKPNKIQLFLSFIFTTNINEISKVRIRKLTLILRLNFTFALIHYIACYILNSVLQIILYLNTFNIYSVQYVGSRRKITFREG